MYDTPREKKILDEPQKQDQQGSRQSYDTISDPAITVQACRFLKSEYDEIEATLQINNLQFSENVYYDIEDQAFHQNICFVLLVKIFWLSMFK